MNSGNRIFLDFKRPDRELVEAFREIPVANLDDCMGRTAAVCPEIVPLGKRKLLGTALTVKVPEGDNLFLHRAMDLIKPGDVVVIAAGGSVNRSIFGGLMANYCMRRGAAGMIVDGSVRDADELAALDMPVYAKGVTPNGPYKNGPGEINVPVSFAGQVVEPGDIVVGDADGILFIKPEEARELLKKGRAVVEMEGKIMDTQEREGTYIRPWLEPKIASLGTTVCEYWTKE